MLKTINDWIGKSEMYCRTSVNVRDMFYRNIFDNTCIFSSEFYIFSLVIYVWNSSTYPRIDAVKTELPSDP